MLIRGLERQLEDKQYNILITIVIRQEDFIMESRTWPYLTSYKEDSASPLMTVPELAEYLDVGRNTVYSLLRDGSIKGFRIGSSWKVSREAVDLFIRIRTTGLAGGLLTPYKGLLPALESKDSSKSPPAAASFT